MALTGYGSRHDLQSDINQNLFCPGIDLKKLHAKGDWSLSKKYLFMESATQTEELNKLWYLKKINLLKELSAEELGFIARCSKMSKLKNGDIVFFQGDPSFDVYFLKEGRVKLSRMSLEGREITLAILDKGEIFGEMSAYSEEHRNVQAQAMEESIVCMMKKSDFLDVLHRSPQLNFKLTKFIVFRRLQIESKIDQLIFNDVPTRLAGLLLSLIEQYGEKDSRGIRIRIKLSHQELGNLIGATRETISALLAQWKKCGFVDSEDRRMIITDSDSLRKVAGASAV